MRDEMLAELLAHVADTAKNDPQTSSDIQSDQRVTGTDDVSHVEITLTGFTVDSVWMDPHWLADALPTQVQQATKDALQQALTNLVDAELQAAQQTSYEMADVQTRLIKLSQEASIAMQERLRTVGGVSS